MTDPDNQGNNGSPEWRPGTRLFVGALVTVLVLVLVYVLRNLVTSIVLAFLIAYMLDPIVSWLVSKARFPRWLAALLVILLFIAALVGATTGIGFAFSQRVIDLVTLFSEVTNQIPAQLDQLGELKFTVGPWAFDLSGISIEPLISNLVSSISPLLSQAGSVMGSVALAAASVITTFFADMVITFYLLLDFQKLQPAFLRLVPDAYKQDFRNLLQEGNRIWRAFLRGQVILALIIGVAVFTTMSVAGLGFPLVMGLIGGLLELVPMFGPVISAVIGALIALVQPTNPWGLSPLAFTLVVLGILIVIQQIENAFLVPRVLGENLDLHPLAVFLAIIAGGALAGFFGILLASPILATLRLIFSYIYSKVMDVKPPVTKPTTPEERKDSQLVDRAVDSVSQVWKRVRKSDDDQENST